MTEFRWFWMSLGVQETLAILYLCSRLAFELLCCCFMSFLECVQKSFPVASKLSFLQVSVIH